MSDQGECDDPVVMIECKCCGGEFEDEQDGSDVCYDCYWGEDDEED